ncbi:MAG: hypothetical protein ABI426_04750 [Flavobacterium sp.]
MNKENHHELTLLGVLIILSIVSIVIGYSNSYTLSYNLYIGIVSLLVSFSLFFWDKRYYRYAFALSLIFAVFGLTYFFPFQVGIQFFSLRIQFIPTVFLLCFSYKYRHQILDLIQNHNTKTEVEKENEILSRTEKFKADFQNLSDMEIENRLKYDLTFEARKALFEIKTERNI